MKAFALLILIFSSMTVAGQNRQQQVVADTIYTKPTVLAAYPGGDTAWKKYVKKHLRYPRKAWWDEVETDVTLRVVIDATGKVVNAQHLTVSGYGFEEEAVRLVLASGRWLPATYHGKAVVSEGQLVVSFKLKR